mgnify:CR=1 FL=1
MRREPRGYRHYHAVAGALEGVAYPVRLRDVFRESVGLYVLRGHKPFERLFGARHIGRIEQPRLRPERKRRRDSRRPRAFRKRCRVVRKAMPAPVGILKPR